MRIQRLADGQKIGAGKNRGNEFDDDHPAGLWFIYVYLKS